MRAVAALTAGGRTVHRGLREKRSEHARLGVVAMLVGTLIQPPATARAGDESADVLAAARRQRFADKTSRVEMRVIAPSGEERVLRTLQGFEKRTDGGRKLLWLFESPAELAGTGFLAWQERPATDEIWVYFPASAGAARVAGSAARAVPGQHLHLRGPDDGLHPRLRRPPRTAARQRADMARTAAASSRRSRRTLRLPEAPHLDPRRRSPAAAGSISRRTA